MVFNTQSTKEIIIHVHNLCDNILKLNYVTQGSYILSCYILSELLRHSIGCLLYTSDAADE